MFIRPSLRIEFLVRLVVRTSVAIALFGYYHQFSYLRMSNAARMLVGDDWTTYIVSPNYLRNARVVSFPLAEVPHYIAPLGTNLAHTDSIPVLMPFYRVVISLFPGRPIQLVGLTLLAATILVFHAIARFLDHVQTSKSWLVKELCILSVASIAVIAPFWNLQYVHPALMQQWIIVWALSGALRRCPTVLSGRLSPLHKRWVGLGAICAAAAVQPYLIPMVAVPALAPDVAHWRTEWRWISAKIGLAGGLVVAITVGLGYLGSGGQLGSSGFGMYAGDLATLIDSNLQSRFVDDLPTTPGAIGGYGYAGLGALVMIFIGMYFISKRRRRISEETDGTKNRRSASLLYVAVGMLTLFSLLPNIRLFGRSIIHFERIANRFSSLTALFRVNGRFVWVVLWLLILLAGAQILLVKSQTAVLVFVGCLLLQVADVVAFPPLLRPTKDVQYSAALKRLSLESQTGARTLQFQPPVLIPGCYAPEYPSFAALGDVLLAAAVLDIPVNSGYTARLEPKYEIVNCKSQSEDFLRGAFSASVVYVLPISTPVPSGLRCSMITTPLLACRTK